MAEKIIKTEKKEKIFGATGRRKTSVARVWMKAGKGNILINNKPLQEYFYREAFSNVVRQPLVLTKTSDRYDIKINVQGGGLAGQAGAVRHGISRAIVDAYPEGRDILKKSGMLTRDPRMKERKKYGQPGARKKFQFSKR